MQNKIAKFTVRTSIGYLVDSNLITAIDQWLKNDCEGKYRAYWPDSSHVNEILIIELNDERDAIMFSLKFLNTTTQSQTASAVE